MGKKTRRDNNKVVRYILILLMLFFYSLFIVLRFNPVFPRIDDIKMRWIISGAYTGEGSSYALFIKYPLAYIIMLLYKWIPNIPWYGGIFIVIHVFCLFVIISRVLRMFSISKITHVLFSSAMIILIFSFFNIENIVLLEYTSLAALTGSTAIFTLIVEEKTSILDYFLSLFLLLLCYNLRLSVFRMVIAFVLVVLCTKIILKRPFSKLLNSLWCNNKILIIFTVIGIFSIAGIKTINDFAYSPTEWKTFREYNSYRSRLFDHDTIPDYWENEVFYQSLGITEEVYYSILDYNIGFSEIVSIDTINEIYDKSNDYKEETSLKKGILATYDVLFDDNHALTTSLLIILTVFNLVLLFWNKRTRLFIGYAICIGGILLECIYIGIGGRFPDRVVMAITLLWTFINCGYFVRILKELKLNIKYFQNIILFRKAESILLICGIVFILAVVLIIKYDIISTKRYESISKLINMQPVKEYISNNEENFYFITTHMLSRDYVETWNETPTYCNFHELGGWEMFSPCYHEKMENKNIDSIEDSLLENHTYLITDELYAADYMLQYYDQKYEESVTMNIDHRIESNKTVYYVIKFSLKNIRN